MSTFVIRWRDDAQGFVARYAGMAASREFACEAAAEAVLKGMPNGDQAEIVEVGS